MLIGSCGAFVFNLLFGLGAYLGVLGTGPLLLGFLATAWTLNMYFQSYSALAADQGELGLVPRHASAACSRPSSAR